MFDFDTPVSRIGTHAEKYTAREKLFGRADVMPFWVADMEFAVPATVRESLAVRFDHPVYGYTSIPEALPGAITSWNRKRYGLTLSPDAVTVIPGVMAGVSAALYALSEPGDGVVIQTPLYPPLGRTVQDTGRLLRENPLLLQDDGYGMDLAGLEELCLRHRPKIFLLCSPHNPVGRVWRRDEIARLIDLVNRHGMYLVSDEIHADIIFPPHAQISALSVPEVALERTVVLNSASKSFNIAGLQTAYALIPDRQLRTAFRRQLRAMNLHAANVFGMTALGAAYLEGEQWLDALLLYLRANRDYMAGRLNMELPGLNHFIPEGTYLYWLDFNSLGPSPADIRRKLVDGAGVGLNDGATFSSCHEGFWRFNFGVPRSMLAEGLDRIVNVFSC